MAKKHQTITRRKGGSVALRSKTLSDGRRSLRLDIYKPRKNGTAERHVETLGLYLDGGPDDDATLADAQQRRTQREREMTSGAIGVTARRTRGVIDYFRSVIAAHIGSDEKRHVRSGSKRSSTEEGWDASLKALQRFAIDQGLPDDWSFSELTTERCARYRSWLLDRSVSKLRQNSAATYLGQFRQVLRSAARDGLIGDSILLGFPTIRREEGRVEYLTIEEVRKLAETKCGNPHVKRAFLFRCYTGLRDSDVRQLNASRIVNNQIVFRQQKVRRKGAIEYLPLSEQARAILGECEPDKDGFYFPLPALSPELKVLKTWAERAGITKHVTTHVARHTFATLAITYGADLYCVSELLGHSDIKTTTIYAKIVGERKRMTVELIPSIAVERSIAIEPEDPTA